MSCLLFLVEIVYICNVYERIKRLNGILLDMREKMRPEGPLKDGVVEKYRNYK